MVIAGTPKTIGHTFKTLLTISESFKASVSKLEIVENFGEYSFLKSTKIRIMGLIRMDLIQKF